MKLNKKYKASIFFLGPHDFYAHINVHKIFHILTYIVFFGCVCNIGIRNALTVHICNCLMLTSDLCRQNVA